MTSKQQQRCYYEVMGLSKSSTPEQIKKAYKKLAVKWHPDKNPNNKQEAVQRFRQIAQAYEVLTDEQKRKQYDTYGFNAPKMGGGGFHHFDFSEANNLFKNFFASSGFDNANDEEFFGSFFGKGKKKKGFGFGGGMGSMFDNDDFFKAMGGMGGGNGFSSFSSSSFGGSGGGGGLSKSVSTVTKTVNGKTVVVRKTTLVNPDGTKQVTQQTNEGGTKLQKKYSLGPNQGQSRQVNYF